MNKILEIKFGSHLYGTNTENSDLDLKAIYIPTAKEIVLGNYKKTISTCRPKQEGERNTKDDVDIEIFSLDRYLDLLVQGQTVALDMLFAPIENYTLIDSGSNGQIMSEIYKNKDKLLTKNVTAFIGYAKMQASKYGIKGSRMDALKRTKEMLDGLDQSLHTKLSSCPETINDLVIECQSLISLEKTSLVEIVMLKGPKGLIDQPHLKVNGRAIPFHVTVKYAKEIVCKMLEGYGQRAHKAHLAGSVDWKALSHAVRVNSEGVELLTTGHITFPRPDRELLLKIKLGQMPYKEVAEMIEQGLADLIIAREKSLLWLN
jgi:hypothetical protein